MKKKIIDIKVTKDNKIKTICGFISYQRFKESIEKLFKNKYKKCTYCQGIGIFSHRNFKGYYEPIGKCPKCNGSGKVK